MNNGEARNYFANKGLTYEILNPSTIDLLVSMIQDEIELMKRNTKDCILLKVNPHKYNKKQLHTGNYNNLELLVSGTYFDKREAITFNSDGFIGFAGWASSDNTKPIITAFIKWCDRVS